LGGLCIIWTAFLIPWKRARYVRRSPRSSVEEFERKMSMLEDANSHPAPGRWVLTPKKDEWFMGSEERARHRVRDRRKRVFLVLLEAIAASLLIGAAPPLHRIWIATGLLVLALLGYCALLVKLRGEEAAAARRRRALPRRRQPVLSPRYGAARTRTREEDLIEAFEAAGLQVASFDGDRGGPDVRTLAWDDRIQIIEDDVHVVVRRPEPTTRRDAVSS
jgi:hypothetical protein